MAIDGTLERRIVSVLFADLVGFTTLSEQFDAEDIAAIQDSYFGAVRETVGRYGGRLEKFIGDAAMAVFGVPRSRDDDAQRAVRAGLALIHAVEDIGTHLGLDEGSLRLRVGINTGEVVIAPSGPDEGRVTGDTVNTAARLQTAAPPGGVLIGPTTALAVAEFAELQPVPPLQLKGKAKPTAASLVTELRAEASREQAMGELRAPTLGREAELRALSDGFGRAAKGGVERWLIVAPPGVGKSRLMIELATRITGEADAPVARLRSRARPDSVSPFDPLAGLLLDALPTERDEAHGLLITRLAEANVPAPRARVVADACVALAWPVAAATATPSAATPSEDRDALFEAWLEGLDALAGDAVALWMVEDVHWAGGDVLAFLELAGQRPRIGRGRLLIATARPSLLDAQPDWCAADESAGRHVLQLSTLEHADARDLVGALVGHALPPELVDQIAQRSDGNCLFIEELLRTWVSVGTLVRDGDGWRLAVAADEIALPASVQSIYAGQLDDLPPDARRLARRASVAGRRFPLGALEPLGAQSDDGLEHLRRRALVSGPLVEPLLGDAFSYRHALLRDAGYASLARAERARLHVRLARWLEQAGGERSSEVAEQIAGHYSAALENAPALAREIDDGLDRDALRRLAAEWYERAGQDTLAVSAHDAARQLLRRAIDLTAEDARLEMARRWERLADATAFAADMDEGAAAYRQAMDLYRAVMAEGRQALDAGLAEARAGLARATSALSDVMYQQLRFDDSRAMAEKVIDELGPAADAGSLARLLVARAMGRLGAAGPTPETLSDMERAFALAGETGDARLALRAKVALTMARHESGAGDAADWSAVEQAALQLGDWGEAVGATLNSVLSQLDSVGPAVFDAVQRVRDLAGAHGRTEDGGWADYAEAEASFVGGEWDRALTAGERAIELGEANAYLRLTVRTWHVVIPIAAVRGNRELLEHAARWYAGLVGKFEFPDSPYSRIIRAAQDLELAAAGLIPAYVPELDPRIASFVDDPSGPSWSAALDRVFRAWLEAGELDGAARALDAQTEALPRYPSITDLGRGTHLLMRGRLDVARGNADAAAAAGHAALTHFRKIGAPWWMAKTMRLLERAGAADPALVSEAFEIERRLGATGPTA